MTNTIELQVTVPLIAPILLSHFYQYKIDQFPKIRKENISIRLWFDTDCIDSNPTTPPEGRIRMRPMMMSQIKAQIVVHDVSDEFANFVLLPIEHQIIQQALSEQYVQYGEQIYDFLFGTINRTLSFIRAHQGQFWIEELRLEDRKDLRSILGGFAYASEITAQIVESTTTFTWNPLRKPMMVQPQNGPDQRQLQPDDWDKVWSFVDSSARTDLVRELINGALRLAMQGHSRAALTEVVTALETAMHRFARRPRMDLLSEVPLKRLQVESVPKAMEHLGITQSVRYLLPLLFADNVLSLELIQACDEAVTLRHDVVHTGRRSVDRIDEHISAISELCALLMDSTESADGK